MPVPSSYNDLKEGVDFREFCGWAFYQRTIAVPSFALGERVMLRFAAVTHHAKVFLNGHEICCHVGGFLPFEVQLNEWLKPGDNLLTVAVDNPIVYSTLPVGGKANMMAGLMGGMGSSPSDGKKANNPNFDFFNYAGITRQVCIYTTPAEHIDDIEVVADVQDETGGDPSATISYKVAATGDADCRVELLDAKGQKVAESSGGENLPMDVKDISLMKWQGANSFRTSHYPYSEEMMRLCDAEGIVVIDETTAVGVNLKFGGGANFGGEHVSTFDPVHGVQTQEIHKQVIRDLVARDKNHACVVMWSIANEPDSASEGAYEYFKPLYDFARELDPQKRPCTLASVQGTTPQNDCSAKLSDVICLNR